MTRNQFHREQLRQARERELRVLADGRSGSDPRYVDDVVAWMWAQVVDRKLQLRDSLPFRDRQRLNTLVGLYS